VGDARAVEPILAILEDESVSDLVRGIAALAMGFIAEPVERPWNTVLALDVAYPASPATLFDPGGGGVLNIR
jgi:HEAT repeat protein